jgi:hypothetical protein
MIIEEVSYSHPGRNAASASYLFEFHFISFQSILFEGPDQYVLLRLPFGCAYDIQYRECSQ